VVVGPGLVGLGAGAPAPAPCPGPPARLARAQAGGAPHRIDGRTDIYSLGVVLYEVLCGRLPFRASNIRELLRQVRDDEPQPPRQLAREIPPELEQACLKAMAKRLQDRYTTAADFAEDLRRVGQSPSGSAMPSSSWLAWDTAPTGVRLSARALSSRQSALTPSSTSRRAREAERRQVTVLVCGCDLFESEAY